MSVTSDICAGMSMTIEICAGANMTIEICAGINMTIEICAGVSTAITCASLCFFLPPNVGVTTRLKPDAPTPLHVPLQQATGNAGRPLTGNKITQPPTAEDPGRSPKSIKKSQNQCDRFKFF